LYVEAVMCLTPMSANVFIRFSGLSFT
jgi:hypothetical protein